MAIPPSRNATLLWARKDRPLYPDPNKRGTFVERSPSDPRGDSYGEFYGSRAPSAFGMRFHRFWHRRMFEMAAKLVPAMGMEGVSILEIGVGHGFFAETCLQKGVRYAGIELNEEQARRMRSRGFDVVQGSVPPIIPGPQASVVWMSHVLEHARDHVEAHDMVCAVKERMTHGGYLVVIAPDIHAWGSEFWSVDWSHGYPTSLRRVRELLDDCGLDIVAAGHHTATCGPGWMAFVLSALFKLIPVRLLDGLFKAFTGREFAYAFMGLYGWRQILVVGQNH